MDRVELAAALAKLAANLDPDVQPSERVIDVAGRTIESPGTAAVAPPQLPAGPTFATAPAPPAADGPPPGYDYGRDELPETKRSDAYHAERRARADADAAREQQRRGGA